MLTQLAFDTSTPATPTTMTSDGPEKPKNIEQAYTFVCLSDSVFVINTILFLNKCRCALNLQQVT